MSETDAKNERLYQPTSDPTIDNRECPQDLSDRASTAVRSWTRQQKYILCIIGIVCIDFLVRFGDGRAYDLPWQVKSISMLILAWVLIAWVLHNWRFPQSNVLTTDDQSSDHDLALERQRATQSRSVSRFERTLICTAVLLFALMAVVLDAPIHGVWMIVLCPRLLMDRREEQEAKERSRRPITLPQVVVALLPIALMLLYGIYFSHDRGESQSIDTVPIHERIGIPIAVAAVIFCIGYIWWGWFKYQSLSRMASRDRSSD